jgi:hypothetical protein
MAFHRVDTDTRKIAPDGFDSIYYRKSWYRDSDDDEYMDLILYFYKEKLFRFDLIYGLDMLRVSEHEATYFELYPEDSDGPGYRLIGINTIGGPFPLGKFVEKFKRASEGIPPEWKDFFLNGLTGYKGMIEVEPIEKDDE